MMMRTLAKCVKAFFVLLLALSFAACSAGDAYVRAPRLQREAWLDDYVWIEMTSDFNGFYLHNELRRGNVIRTARWTYTERFVNGRWWTVYVPKENLAFDALTIFELPATIDRPGVRYLFSGVIGDFRYEPVSGGRYRTRLPIAVHLEDRQFEHDLVYEFYWP